jgi:hypothetical protein
MLKLGVGLLYHPSNDMIPLSTTPNIHNQETLINSLINELVKQEAYLGLQFVYKTHMLLVFPVDTIIA